MIRIFLVEDHKIVQAGLRRLIEAQEDMCVCGQAETAFAAKKLLDTERPDIVSLDLSLPGGMPLKLISEFSKNHPDCKFLVLTFHDDPAHLKSAIAAGCSGYVLKSSSPTVYLDAIRAVAGGGTWYAPDIATEKPPPEADSPSGGAGHRPHSDLSAQERETLALLALGYSYQEIGDKMFLSVKTVETYRTRIGKKLNLKSKAELVRYALDMGITPDDEAERPAS